MGGEAGGPLGELYPLFSTPECLLSPHGLGGPVRQACVGRSPVYLWGEWTGSFQPLPTHSLGTSSLSQLRMKY